MGRDYSQGKLSQMVLPKRPCLEESRPIDLGGGGGAGADGGGATAGGEGGGRNVISDDVLFYVGKRRQPYNVSAESLTRGSAYFRNLLQRNPGARFSSAGRGGRVMAQLPPIVMDCAESIFESMLLLIRYGTWEALPPMSEAEAFRLKREAEFYGVQYMEPPPRLPLPSKTPTSTNTSDQSSVSALSPASSPGGSPKSDTNSVRSPACRRLSHDGVRLVGTTTRQLAELPDFPLDLSDPAKLVLVTCLDEEKAPIYNCGYCRSTGGAGGAGPTQWALSFHHRHAFCTSCGRKPSNMPPKHFAEMFTAAVAHYVQSTPLDQATVKPQAAWWVVSDSTCILRFVSSACSGPDACTSASCAASSAPLSAAIEAGTVWAATFFYSHAFCTRCGQPANGPTLLSLLLAIRYGGASNKSSKSARSSFKIPATPSGLSTP